MVDLKKYGPYGARNVSVNMGRFVTFIKAVILWVAIVYAACGFWDLLDWAIEVEFGGP